MMTDDQLQDFRRRFNEVYDREELLEVYSELKDRATFDAVARHLWAQDEPMARRLCIAGLLVKLDHEQDAYPGERWLRERIAAGLRPLIWEEALIGFNVRYRAPAARPTLREAEEVHHER